MARKSARELNSVGEKRDDKRFMEWIEQKETLHFAAGLPRVKEGEVWWAAVGENVGVEINGKSKKFSRPVVILKKFSRLSFMAVPLTSQEHNGSWWVEIEFLGKREFACLTQTRAMSVSRLYNKIGALPQSDLDKIGARLKQLLF